jgi:Spy/CpxP family protein refolding chaperone
MKKLLSVFVLSLLSAVAVAEPPQEGRGHFMGQLDLSAEQKEQMREIRENGGGRDEMRAVLTAEQQAKLDELREAKRGKRGPNIERMKQHLDLTDEQANEISGIIDAGGSREEIQEVLTEEQKAKMTELRKLHGGKGKPRGQSGE